VQTGAEGAFRFPGARRQVGGGPATVAVGCDDRERLRNRERGAEETAGAFLIRGSWGGGVTRAAGGPRRLRRSRPRRGPGRPVRAGWEDSGEFGL